VFVGREIIVHIYGVMFTRWLTKAIFSNKSGVAIDRIEQARSHVVDSANHHETLWQERECANARDVADQC
jgi:hypothetical protein